MYQYYGAVGDFRACLVLRAASTIGDVDKMSPHDIFALVVILCLARVGAQVMLSGTEAGEKLRSLLPWRR